MSGRFSFFRDNEIVEFCDHVWGKFRGGVRTPIGLIYGFATLVGVGWATWGIPAINGSHISPETLGIYVIGFLITVLLDAGVTLAKKLREEEDFGYDTAATVMCFILSIALVIWASYLSIRADHVPLPSPSPPIEPKWKFAAYPLLAFILSLAVLMWFVLSGIDPKGPTIGPLDKSPGAVRNR